MTNKKMFCMKLLKSCIPTRYERWCEYLQAELNKVHYVKKAQMICLELRAPSSLQRVRKRREEP